jgi:hypothetical protein
MDPHSSVPGRLPTPWHGPGTSGDVTPKTPQIATHATRSTPGHHNATVKKRPGRESAGARVRPPSQAMAKAQ